MSDGELCAGGALSGKAWSPRLVVGPSVDDSFNGMVQVFLTQRRMDIHLIITLLKVALLLHL